MKNKIKKANKFNPFFTNVVESKNKTIRHTLYKKEKLKSQ